MWAGYGYLNGVELWNNQRTTDYLRGNPVAGLAGLALPTTTVTPWSGCDYAYELFCDPPLVENAFRYTTPANDDAPWYDSGVPESGEFAGLFVTEVVGFDSVVERSVAQGAIRGSSLGPLRLSGRTITVTGWLRAGSCCGAEYGLRWLAEALIQSTACADCAIGEMFMLKCCPTVDCPDAMDYLRYLERVGLVDGPKVVDRMGTCCASCGYTNLKVQFTLVSESPYLFSEVDWCAYEEAFPEEEVQYDFYSGCDDCGEPAVDSFVPDCGPVPVVPPAPYMVPSNCYCDPWCSKQLLCSFENPYQWNDATGYIEISTGNAPLKNLKISGYRNPYADQGLSCADFIAQDGFECIAACAVLEIAELPSGSTLVIDGRTRTVSLRLAGGTYVPGLRYISGEDGGPFGWFDIGYCQTLCLLVTVDCSVAADAQVSIGAVGRFLASGG